MRLRKPRVGQAAVGRHGNARRINWPYIKDMSLTEAK